MNNKRLFLVIISLLVLAISFMAIERLFVAEYVDFLERDMLIKEAYRNIKIGMTEAEVRNLLVMPPDIVYEDRDRAVTVKAWSMRDRRWPIHNFFGTQPGHLKSYMDLHLEFDTEDRLVWTYYGG